MMPDTVRKTKSSDSLIRAQTLGNEVIRRFAEGGGTDLLTRAEWDKLNTNWNRNAELDLPRRASNSRDPGHELFNPLQPTLIGNPLLAATVEEMRLGYLKLFAEKRDAILAKAAGSNPADNATAYFAEKRDESPENLITRARNLNADYDLTNYTYAWFQRLQRPGIGCSHPERIHGPMSRQDMEWNQKGMPKDLAFHLLSNVIRRSVDSFRNSFSYDFSVKHWALSEPEFSHPNAILDAEDTPPPVVPLSAFAERSSSPLGDFFRKLGSYLNPAAIGF